MVRAANSARKKEVLKRAVAAFEPSKNASASRAKKFELDGTAGFLLNDDCSRPHTSKTAVVAESDVSSAKQNPLDLLSRNSFAKVSINENAEYRVKNCLYETLGWQSHVINAEEFTFYATDTVIEFLHHR